MPLRFPVIQAFRPFIQVQGAEPLVSQVVAGLQAGGRPARSISVDEPLAIKPGRVRTLILADPEDPIAVLARLDAGFRQTQGRRAGGSVRVILMHRRDPPPDLTGLALDARLRVETFAVENRAARALLTRWPLHLGMDPPFGQWPHLLLAGSAPPADAVLIQSLRQLQYGDRRPLVTLLSRDPKAAAARLRDAHPQLGQVAEIRFGTLSEPDLAPDLTQVPPVTLGLVALDEPPEEGLAVARLLTTAITAAQRVSPPILLEIGDREVQGGVGEWDGQLIPVSYVSEVCRPGVLLDGVGDAVAQSIHQHYRDTIAAQGRDPDSESAGQPWGRLAASYRQANRHQADHLPAKLAITDCRAVPEEMVESFAFTPLEVERLALIEHQRWAADRHLDGWSHAPVRDNARRHHPQLIPYSALSEPMKDLDRFAVRGVPTLLARSGFGVLRMLILAIPDSGAFPIKEKRLDRLATALLERLRARYPDRALIVATSLMDADARRVVRQALERADAGLFWLMPGPVGEMLAALDGEAARADLLALAARAERRVMLDGQAEVRRWIAERAEIQLNLGRLGAAPATAPARQVSMSAAQGLDWNFEY